MALRRALRLLEETIGLDAGRIGADTIRHALGQRREATNLEDAERYVDFLERTPEELEHLIEAVVVHETWFFREPETIGCVVEHAVRRTRRDSTELYRVLSVGCATGEEPYSVAIALAEGGIPESRFRVEALDISATAITRAGTGVFGDRSFRRGQPTNRDRHFRQTDEGWSVLALLRDSVETFRANALDLEALTGRGPYDAILCRNLLIYLTRDAQQKLLSSLVTSLCGGGVIAVGSAEAHVARSAGLVAARAGIPVFSIQATGPLDEPASSPRPPDASPPKGPRTAPPAGTRRRAGAGLNVRTSRQRLRQGRAAAPPDVPERCWNSEGVFGANTCPSLKLCGHCHRCWVFAREGRQLFERPPSTMDIEERTAALAAPLPAPDGATRSLLIFRVGTHWCSFPLESIREVAPAVPIRRLPHRSNERFLGLANIRGALQLCFSLHALLEVGPPSRSNDSRRFVILETGSADAQETWAFPVEDVRDVRTLRPDELATSCPHELSDFATSSFEDDGRTVHILDSGDVAAACRRSCR